MKVLIFLCSTLIAVCWVNVSKAQISLKNSAIITADSLKSGNAKDVLVSFFQLSFDRLTSKDKQVNFSSNPFAILLKSNPHLAVDTNYHKYRTLRKTNFNFGLKLDSSYRFNGFSSAVKFAILDKRDTTTSQLLLNNLRADSLKLEADNLQDLLLDHAMTIPDLTQRNNFRKKADAFLYGSSSFSLLDDSLKTIVRSFVNGGRFPLLFSIITNNPATTIYSAESKRFNDYKNEIKKGLLWTVSLTDTTYKDQFFFSNVLLQTELLKGMGKLKAGSNWELNIKGGLNFIDDSLSKGRDLKRMLLGLEPGINLVIRNNRNDQSFLEMKFSGAYHRNFNALYTGEKRDSLSLNTTLRFKIINDIWIPLEIKYDPRSGNVFGFLNVRSNFTALGKLLQ